MKIFWRRYADRMVLYPIIAMLLALVLWARDGRAEIIPKRLSDGSIRLCENLPPWPVLAFCVVLTTERR